MNKVELARQAPCTTPIVCYHVQMVQAANVLLLSTDGRLILQQRDDKPGIVNPGQISAFGGSCEAGETALAAAKREMREELGLELTDQDLTFWKIFTKTRAEHGEDTQIHLFILNRPLHPEGVTVFEGQGYVLVSPNDYLDQINLTKAALRFVADYFKEYKSRG